MNRLFRGLLIALLAVAPLVAISQPAQARTELPVDGANGDAGAKSECPAGQQLVGFSGRTGTWIDRIQIACATPLPGGHFSHPVVAGGQFGGAGGGAVDSFCPTDTMMTGAFLNLTTGKRQIAAIQMACISRATGEHFTASFGNQAYVARCPGIGVGDCPADPYNVQNCPSDEVPLGINVRYGKDVNGFGLICGRVAAPAAPPPPPPAPQKKIKVTGAPKPN